ncbi:MAG: dehydrogenase [Flavobacteriales bacterium]|nr:MAG: dehydrogenase [Flavobacteriales bacterium]
MKRRSFIKQTGLATTAMAASSPILAGIITKKSTKQINIAVIGTGDRGSGLIPYIDEIEGLNLTACCDILPFRLKNGLNKAKGKVKGYSDYRKLLEDKNLDAVLIATTFSEHGKIAADAIAAGKHIYCEKTLAKGYDDIKNLIKKVVHSNLIFQTGHQYHSSRLYTHVAGFLKSGKAGKIAAIESQWNRHWNWRRPVPDPTLEKAINWRMYREFSGGLVAELCSHQIDFSNWILDALPGKVMGVGGIDYWKDGRETYDNVHLIYSYPNGTKATYTCLTSNSKDNYLIKVIGDKGTLQISDSNAWFFPENTGEKKLANVDGVSGATASWVENKGYPIKVSHIEPSKQALIDFKDSILNNTQPISNFKTGANTAICVQMGLDAMYKEKIVTLPKITV